MKKTNLVVVICILAMLCSLYFLFRTKETDKINTIKQENRSLEKEISFYKKETERYTVENIAEQAERDNIDIDKSMQEIEKKIQEGIKKVYKKMFQEKSTFLYKVNYLPYWDNSLQKSSSINLTWYLPNQK